MMELPVHITIPEGWRRLRDDERVSLSDRYFWGFGYESDPDTKPHWERCGTPRFVDWEMWRSGEIIIRRISAKEQVTLAAEQARIETIKEACALICPHCRNGNTPERITSGTETGTGTEWRHDGDRWYTCRAQAVREGFYQIEKETQNVAQV